MISNHMYQKYTKSAKAKTAKAPIPNYKGFDGIMVLSLVFEQCSIATFCRQKTLTASQKPSINLSAKPTLYYYSSFSAEFLIQNISYTSQATAHCKNSRHNEINFD